MKISFKRRTNGFTLIELIVVIAILEALAGIGTPFIISQINAADITACRSNLTQLAMVGEKYSRDMAHSHLLPTSGMDAVTRAEGCIWLRPLLECTRSQLTQWLTERGLSWRDDTTNAVPDVTRNRLRLEVLPALSRAMGRDVVPIINRSARLQSETLQALDFAVVALPSEDPQGRLYLPFVLSQPLPLRKAIIRRYLLQHGVPEVDEEMVVAIDSMLPADATHSRCCLSGGFIAIRRQKQLILSQ